MVGAHKAPDQPLLPDSAGLWPVESFFGVPGRGAPARLCDNGAMSSTPPLPSEQEVTEALRAVIDPELRQSIVDLGMVRSIEIGADGAVAVVVSLTTPGCPIRSHFEQAVAENVAKLGGVSAVSVGFDVLSDSEKSELQRRLGRPGGLPAGALAQVKNVICVASGKGGVGKSTMTANLAAALQNEGKAAGALDADVYGYSIPRMLGVNRRPEVNAERKILPLVSPSGVKVMSIGFFVEENAAVVWRGPMLHKAIQQFLEDVDWGELDYLLLDLPPGTGDVSMTLAQLLPQARFLLVTTPQPAAQSVARRAADMAAKVDLEVLGVVENMSGFTTPDGQRFTIFGEGGGRQLADELGVPLLGSVPLQEELREHADEGSPLVVDDPQAPAAIAIRETARGIVAATPVELPVMQAPAAPMPEPVAGGATGAGGTALPVVEAGGG
jgi:ATP-binding protein involved in chromosome partitioning